MRIHWIYVGAFATILCAQRLWWLLIDFSRLRCATATTVTGLSISWRCHNYIPYSVSFMMSFSAAYRVGIHGWTMIACDALVQFSVWKRTNSVHNVAGSYARVNGLTVARSSSRMISQYLSIQSFALSATVWPEFQWKTKCYQTGRVVLGEIRLPNLHRFGAMHICSGRHVVTSDTQCL